MFFTPFGYAVGWAILAANVYVVLYVICVNALDLDWGRLHPYNMVIGALGVFGAVMLAYYNWPQLF
jgi:hypothetical protein